MLCDHYGKPTNDLYEGKITTADPIINSVHGSIELEGFMEAFDEAVEFLRDELKKKVKVLVDNNSLKDPEAYINTYKINSLDVYKFLATNGCLSQFKNLGKLFKISLLIPPSTSNVERGFSVMNLVCTPLRTSLNEANLDRFMRICINGPKKFNDKDIEKMVDNFKRTKDNRCLDL